MDLAAVRPAVRRELRLEARLDVLPDERGREPREEEADVRRALELARLRF